MAPPQLSRPGAGGLFEIGCDTKHPVPLASLWDGHVSSGILLVTVHADVYGKFAVGSYLLQQLRFVHTIEGEYDGEQRNELITCIKSSS